MGAPWRQLPAAYGKGNSVYRRWAHGCDQGVWPRRSCPRRGGTARSCARGGRAPKRDGISPSVAAGADSAPRSTAWRINGDAPCICALTGAPRRDRPGLDRRAPALPDRRPGLRQRRLPRLASATGHQSRPSGPASASEPPAPRPGTVPGAPRGGTGPRLAHARAARGRPLRPIRTSFPGFSGSGRGLDLDAVKVPQNLITPLTAEMDDAFRRNMRWNIGPIGCRAHMAAVPAAWTRLRDRGAAQIRPIQSRAYPCRTHPRRPPKIEVGCRIRFPYPRSLFPREQIYSAQAIGQIRVVLRQILWRFKCSQSQVALRCSFIRPLYLHPAVGTGLGLARPRLPHQALCHVLLVI